MSRFILGVIVGAAAAMWLQRAQTQQMLERRFAEVQDRANAVLVESRRILEETRRELLAALEAGRRSVEEKAEQIRRPAEAETPPSEEKREEPGQS